MARERRGGAEKGAVRTRKIRPHVPLLTPFILSASTLAANLLGYSREKGVWAKSRSKARCQVPDGCWVLGTGENPGVPGAVAAISDGRISRARRVRRGRRLETAATRRRGNPRRCPRVATRAAPTDRGSNHGAKWVDKSSRFNLLQSALDKLMKTKGRNKKDVSAPG